LLLSAAVYWPETMMMRSAVVAVAVVLAVALAAEASELKVGYYDKSCPGVENVVKWHVAKALKANRKTGAALVRLIFHDCFVRVRPSSL
jgi:hypothetical protein